MTGTAGSISLPPAWQQTDVAAVWNHNLVGADRVYEHVTEVADLVVARAGLYEVDYTARGVVQVPANTLGSGMIVAAIYVNGARIVGSETTPMNFGPSPAVPEVWVGQSQSGMSFVHQLAASDVVQLWAYRVGTGQTCQVVSNGDGRTRIKINRIGR